MKLKSKAKSATRSAARETGKAKSRTRTAPSPSKSATRPDTKHARILAMLRAPAGTTIAAIMTATGPIRSRLLGTESSPPTSAVGR